jgi:hypothetical protein
MAKSSNKDPILSLPLSSSHQEHPKMKDHSHLQANKEMDAQINHSSYI